MVAVFDLNVFDVGTDFLTLSKEAARVLDGEHGILVTVEAENRRGILLDEMLFDDVMLAGPDITSRKRELLEKSQFA